jgi:hypothetical protein
VRPVVALVVAAVALGAAAGCGGGGETAGAVADRTGAVARETVEPVTCPAGADGCRSATGRIVYVERVDPDGDGDAHFVILDPQGISLPGLTSIDVRRGLRPQPLPGPGDLISAAGPVQTGTYGQHQIHALELHVAARDG